MSDIQTVFINGGTTFRSREDHLAFLQNKEVSLQDEETWYNTDYLENKLACEVIKLKMPCRSNARYKEWKITFDKYLQHLSDTIILIGLSLGGTFLAKYLSENTVAKQIQAAYLIGAPYDNNLIGEELVGGFDLSPDLSLLEENCKRLTFMFSKNDDIVPVRHADKFRKQLSEADITIFEKKGGHFQVATFPKLVEEIQNDIASL